MTASSTAGAAPSAADFAELGLPQTLQEGLKTLGFERMTGVQALALPGVLARRDLLVQAEPGSGKTLAFGLGMLAAATPHLPPVPPRVRALALCPTRELAEQIASELRRAACRTPNVKVLTTCGGVPFRAQRESLKQGAHVVVGTPGRVQEHLRKGSLQLDALEVLVLDEADRMLDMGFSPQLEAIVAHAPSARQTLLFSATYPESIDALAARYQRDPERISVALAPGHPAAPAGAALAGSAAVRSGAALECRYHRVAVGERPAALVRWLALERPASVLVFSNTRSECASVAEALRARGWVAASIHGELSQRERAHAMRLFANESCPVLVATDVAARGWDIGGLSAVVNLGLPRDPSVHRHRIGRTGRAGHSGLAVHFVAEEDRGALIAIERQQGHEAVFSELPTSEEPLPPPPPPPPRRTTLVLGAGKNKKLRPGDILGALTAEGGLEADDVGLIHIDDAQSYVAIHSASAERALAILEGSPVKGRSIKARQAGLSLNERR